MTLAHGAGAGMQHRFMASLSKALAEVNVATVRFNFPYMENGKKRPDVPAVAEKTIGAVLQHAASKYPEIPLFAAGKSFGGRMTSQFLSKQQFDRVRGVIFYGFPLHPAGTPAITRAEHLSNVKLPMLFLQGTKDTLAENSLIESVCSKLQTATLDKIEGADHGFMISRKERIDILVDRTVQWIESRFQLLG
ncbi:alpha/beta hydrolase [Pseudochryseolinea flava]|uniref:Alpha/beta hydrolase n=2 Tax=Pseudochryseolinea flava TaxID=2059302 RepID=A0A364Y0A5_9BACT|nr:alpha/beta hydrolase [Pseudochryseolinea flava]